MSQVKYYKIQSRQFSVSIEFIVDFCELNGEVTKKTGGALLEVERSIRLVLQIFDRKNYFILFEQVMCFSFLSN